MKGVVDKEILETFEFSVQKYIRNRHLSSCDKIVVDQCYQHTTYRKSYSAKRERAVSWIKQNKLKKGHSNSSGGW
jgi:hypothetical protein